MGAQDKNGGSDIFLFVGFMNGTIYLAEEMDAKLS